MNDSFPVTDDIEDAPDGARIVLEDGELYERSGNMWNRVLQSRSFVFCNHSCIIDFTCQSCGIGFDGRP